MARKKRRSSPRKQKRSTVLNPPEVPAENENQTIVFVNSHHYPMNPGFGLPTQRSDTHFTGVAQRIT